MHLLDWERLPSLLCAFMPRHHLIGNCPPVAGCAPLDAEILKRQLSQSSATSPRVVRDGLGQQRRSTSNCLGCPEEGPPTFGSWTTPAGTLGRSPLSSRPSPGSAGSRSGRAPTPCCWEDKAPAHQHACHLLLPNGAVTFLPGFTPAPHASAPFCNTEAFREKSLGLLFGGRPGWESRLDARLRGGCHAGGRDARLGAPLTSGSPRGGRGCAWGLDISPGEGGEGEGSRGGGVDFGKGQGKRKEK